MLEENLWHIPEGEERSILGNMIIRECKRTVTLSFGIAGFFVFCMIAGFCEILFGDRDPRLLSISVFSLTALSSSDILRKSVTGSSDPVMLRSSIKRKGLPPAEGVTMYP